MGTLGGALTVRDGKGIVPFRFGDMALREACWMDGNPYFTRRAIGEFLEYRFPDVAIQKIVMRNPHIKKFEGVVKLTTPGGLQKTYIYDPIGLQLIINKSNQPKAIAFQVAVANLVVAYMRGKLKPVIWAPDRASAIRQILSAPPTYWRSRLICDLAEREGVSAQTIYRWIEKVGILKTHKGRKRSRSDAGKTRYPELRAAVLFVKAQMPTLTAPQIANAIGKPVIKSTVNRWIKTEFHPSPR